MVGQTQALAAPMNDGVLDLINHRHSEIFVAWREALGMCWSEAASWKIELLDASREAGTDLVSLTLRLLAGGDMTFSRCVDLLTMKVQHRFYSISDLCTEVDCLEEVLEAALGPSGAEEPQRREAAGRSVRRELRRLFKAVLAETALIHETVIEGGRGGYCRLDEKGVIGLANAQMAALLGVTTAEGVKLLDHISANEKQYVLEAIRGDRGSEPGIRRLHLKKRDGERITVNAEIGPLSIDGKCRGGYAVLTDVSAILKPQESIFDKSPLGIVRLDEERRLIYVNRVAQEILGIGDRAIEDLSIQEFPATEDDQRVLEEQIKLRDQGFSNEYPLNIRRLTDGLSVPITVASMPEVDSSANTVGTLSIIRSRAAQEIDNCIGNCRSDEEILKEVGRITRTLIPSRSFVVSIFSYDNADDLIHTSPIFIHSDRQQSQFSMRWFPVSKSFVAWLSRVDALRRPVPLLIPEWSAFLKEPEAEGLLDIPDVRRSLEEGEVKSFVICAIRLGGRVGATVSLSSTEPNAFKEEHWERLKALPLNRAIQRVLYYRGQREQEFRHQLLREITCLRDGISVAGLLTERLASHYKWQNVSMFLVNEVRGVFELKVQRDGPNDGYLLSESHTQALSEGLLGEAYQTGKTLKINDVNNDQRYAKIYKPTSPRTRSELCLPIKIKDKIRWILNIEDARVNAFSNDEHQILQHICADVEFVFSHLFDFYVLDEIIRAASDYIIITDYKSNIQQLNPAAEYALGIETKNAKGRSIGSFLPDADVARFIVESRKISPVETELFARDGNRLAVLLDGRLLPEDFGCKVYFARNLTTDRRLEELETISRVLYEVAAHARTPLSLVSGWLGRIKSDLAKRSKDGGDIGSIADVVDKAMRQLKKVELPYERVLLANEKSGALPYNERLVDIVRLVEDTIAELPRAEQRRIDKEIAAPLPYVRGDLCQLAFVILTILSYLLRYLPEDECITVRLFEVDTTLHITIKGVVPEYAIERECADPAASLVAEVALGGPIIERFVQQHGGSYEPPAAGGEAEFRITLPWR